MEDIEAFSTTYRARLGEAELAKTIPENIALEVMAFSYCFCTFLVIFTVHAVHDSTLPQINPK